MPHCKKNFELERIERWGLEYASSVRVWAFILEEIAQEKDKEAERKFRSRGVPKYFPVLAILVFMAFGLCTIHFLIETKLD
jgi:hypothetical protein